MCLAKRHKDTNNWTHTRKKNKQVHFATRKTFTFLMVFRVRPFTVYMWFVRTTTNLPKLTILWIIYVICDDHIVVLSFTHTYTHTPYRPYFGKVRSTSFVTVQSTVEYYICLYARLCLSVFYVVCVCKHSRCGNDRCAAQFAHSRWTSHIAY